MNKQNPGDSIASYIQPLNGPTLTKPRLASQDSDYSGLNHLRHHRTENRSTDMRKHLQTIPHNTYSLEVSPRQESKVMKTQEVESSQIDEDYGTQSKNGSHSNFETLAYKILLQKSDMDIASIFKTYALNLKHEEVDSIVQK